MAKPSCRHFLPNNKWTYLLSICHQDKLPEALLGVFQTICSTFPSSRGGVKEPPFRGLDIRPTGAAKFLPSRLLFWKCKKRKSMRATGIWSKWGLSNTGPNFPSAPPCRYRRKRLSSAFLPGSASAPLVLLKNIILLGFFSPSLQ